MKAEYLIVNREKEVIGAVYEDRRRADAAQLEEDIRSGRVENLHLAQETEYGAAQYNLAAEEQQDVRIWADSVLPLIEDRSPEPSRTEDIRFLHMMKDLKN